MLRNSGSATVRRTTTYVVWLLDVELIMTACDDADRGRLCLTFIFINYNCFFAVLFVIVALPHNGKIKLYIKHHISYQGRNENFFFGWLKPSRARMRETNSERGARAYNRGVGGRTPSGVQGRAPGQGSVEYKRFSALDCAKGSAFLPFLGVLRTSAPSAPLLTLLVYATVSYVSFTMSAPYSQCSVASSARITKAK